MLDSFAKRWRLPPWIARCDRLARLSFCFAIFGGMCLFYMPIVLLLRVVFQPWPRPIGAINRCMSRFAFRMVILSGTMTGLIRVRFHGTADPCALLVCNHISLLDVLFVLARFRNCFTFVHSKFHQNPLMGPMITGSNYIVVDPKNIFSRKRAIERAAELLRDGGRIVIFPEGTRSRDGRLGILEEGAFRLAMQLNLPITPVFILASGPLLNKTGWRGMSHGRVTFDIHLGTPIPCDTQSNLGEGAKAMRGEFVGQYRSLLAGYGSPLFNKCPDI